MAVGMDRAKPSRPESRAIVSPASPRRTTTVPSSENGSAGRSGGASVVADIHGVCCLQRPYEINTYCEDSRGFVMFCHPSRRRIPADIPNCARRGRNDTGSKPVGSEPIRGQSANSPARGPNRSRSAYPARALTSNNSDRSRARVIRESHRCHS